MINDFSEIKNEEDRKLYAQLRNILDNCFITQVELHKEKDHLFHECELFDAFKELKNVFFKQLRKECKATQLAEIEVIEHWIGSNEFNMFMHMSSLIVLYEEYNKRKQ